MTIIYGIKIRNLGTESCFFFENFYRGMLRRNSGTESMESRLLGTKQIKNKKIPHTVKPGRVFHAKMSVL
jgi:hypothetical protein